MKELSELGWIDSRKFGVSIYEESEQLSDVMGRLHETLQDTQRSMDLMLHVIQALSSAWRVQETYESDRSGWSKLRTYELLASNDGPVIATLLTYADSHGGMWIELVVNSDIRYQLAQALESFLRVQTPDTSIAAYHRSNV